MNKKFYTLVAGLLLASSVGTFTQAQNPSGLSHSLQLDIAPVDFGVSQLQGVSNDGKGYEVGIAYALGADNANLLYVDGTKTLKYGNPRTATNSQGRPVSSISEYTDRALWVLQQIIPGDQNGSNLPKYIFVNKFTRTVLAFNTSDVNKGVSELGGSQTEWLSSPSYSDPTEAHIYVSLGSDQVAALAYDNTNKVSLVKTDALFSNVENYTLLKVKPHVVENAYWLSANQLNTMLGKAGTTATAESYFTFNFSPEATMNGKVNKLGVDLQAIAVMQAELQYGKSATDGGTGKFDGDNAYLVNAYSSLHPVSGNHHVTNAEVSTYENLDDENYNYGYAVTATKWVALRNREGKYLVVDTAYINGTNQTNNGRITFAWDDLYNLKKDSRYRDPRSYLFKVAYDPSTEEVKIYAHTFVKKALDEGHEGISLVDLYQSQGEKQPIKQAQKWYADVVSSNTEGVKTQVINAALVNLNEVSLGTADEETDNNTFTIKLGNSSAYVPTTIAPGAYLIQIVDDTNPDYIGKYLANTLRGGFEIKEQAARQNFQHMPSAQWIVESTGSAVGAPLTITNREFSYVADELEGAAYLDPRGIFFAENPNRFYKFIPVEDATDAYLGYKYVADDTIKISRFNFNYLHDLAMDKPINTVSAKDSVVWVDKDGEAMDFVLEPAIASEDTYGYNGGVKGVAQLKRMPYYIKVNDFSNVENNARYLSYNDELKKYVVGRGKTAFFLKENNEVQGGDCYYTLVVAGFMSHYDWDLTRGNFIKVSGDGSANNPYQLTGTVTSSWVFDNDGRGAFISEYAPVTNTETGVASKQWKVKLYDQADAEALVPANGIYEVVDFGNTVTGKYAIRVRRDLNLTYLYATRKVSVDNNTLNLTNGDIYDGAYDEVANSAFAVKKVDNPLYRRFNTALEGNEDGSDKPAVVNFYRVNATDKEYLYEDATSGYSKDLKFNFLGVEDKGVAGKNPAMYVDTAYVDRGDLNLKPQYMLVLNPEFVAGETNICDATNHAHATEEEAMACPHSSFTRDSLHGRFLINLKDSVDYHKNTALAAKYQWYQKYTRLGFVEATHVGDSLIIKNSVYTGNNKQINPKKETTWASKDTINLNSADHKSVTFSFRLLNNNSNDFLIESEGASAIAPLTGGWVKIQNGVPVIANGNYNEVGKDAEVFNVEVATTAPTANEAVAAEVSVVAAQGAIIVKGAAGKVVTVANILGQTIANQVAASDNVTIAAPAGVAVVTVDGEATKVIVK
ncbi:hypothetical protein JQM83_00020 [Parabacteroides distasonis]|nr:hypothetical protein [Parabacteroides distasonis]